MTIGKPPIEVVARTEYVPVHVPLGMNSGKLTPAEELAGSVTGMDALTDFAQGLLASN
jgi:hypothetical protein